MNWKKLLYRVVGPVVLGVLAASVGVALTRPTSEIGADYDVPTDPEPEVTVDVAPVKRAPKTNTTKEN